MQTKANWLCPPGGKEDPYFVCKTNLIDLSLRLPPGELKEARYTVELVGRTRSLAVLPSVFDSSSQAQLGRENIL